MKTNQILFFLVALIVFIIFVLILMLGMTSEKNLENYHKESTMMNFEGYIHWESEKAYFSEKFDKGNFSLSEKKVLIDENEISDALYTKSWKVKNDKYFSGENGFIKADFQGELYTTGNKLKKYIEIIYVNSYSVDEFVSHE